MSEREQFLISIREQTQHARGNYDARRGSADPTEREVAAEDFLDEMQSISGQIGRRLAKQLLAMGLPPEFNSLAANDPRLGKVEEALKEYREEEDEMRKALGLGPP
jgi:hypothetical protein